MKKGFPEKILKKKRPTHPIKTKKIIVAVILIMINIRCFFKYSRSLNFPRTAWKKLSYHQNAAAVDFHPNFSTSDRKKLFSFSGTEILKLFGETILRISSVISKEKYESTSGK